MSKRDRNMVIFLLVLGILSSGGYLALMTYDPGEKTIYKGTLSVSGGQTVCESGRASLDTTHYEQHYLMWAVDPSDDNVEFYVLKSGYMENYGRLIDYEWIGNDETWADHLEISDIIDEGENIFYLCGRNWNSQTVSFDADMKVRYETEYTNQPGTPTPTDGGGPHPTPTPGGDGGDGDFWNKEIGGIPTWLLIAVGGILLIGLIGGRRR